MWCFNNGFRISGVAAIVFGLVLLSGCSGDPPESGSPSASPAPAEQPVDNSLTVHDQAGDGTSFEIAHVGLAGVSAYVVVYRSTNGAPGEMLGVSDLLSPGSHDDLAVTPAVPVVESGDFFAILHEEQSGNTMLDFPRPDGPIEEDGRVLADVFSVEIIGN